MSKVFYTEIDIEDLARRGVKEIPITDNTVVTDVARERAAKLGISLRPAQLTGGTRTPAAEVAAPVQVRQDLDQLVAQVKADVVAKLGPQVDPALIEKIVRRVVGQLETS